MIKLRNDPKGFLRIKGQVCAPRVGDLTRLIIEKAHSLRYSIHSRATKMYHCEKQYYQCYGIKRDIVEFVAT